LLYLKFFDAFSATFKNSQIINFRSQKIKALLVYLAVEAGRVHQRDTLVDLLWSEQPTVSGKKNFSQSLSRLQRAIANQQAVPPYLIITRHTVQWNLDSGYWLDVNTFLQATENALSQVEQFQFELSTAYEQLETAYNLYQGDFLAGFFVADAPEFDNWVAATREQLYQQMLSALAHVTQRAEEVGHYEQAIKLAQRQIELNSWNEPAHRSLMRGLAFTGRRSDAIAQFDHCVDILAAELDVDPSQETTILHQQIVDGLYSPDRNHDRAVIVGLPAQDSTPSTTKQSYQPPIRTTHFIGRTRELEEIVTRLGEPETRLITLTGPGGAGKTSLAQEVGRTVCDEYTNGALFVPMASIDRALEIAPAILEALKQPTPDKVDPVGHLLTYLEAMDLLLVLDNYEQLLSTPTASQQSRLARHLISMILERAPQVKLLITSRVRLNLTPEWVYAVDGMTLPPVVDPLSQEYAGLKLEQVEQSSAVALFVRNAQQARSSFILAEHNMQAVTQLCHALGGLPLGLELAAGWVRVLSCQEIYAEIQENLEILTVDSPDVPARHRSIQAVFDSSWQRLSSGAQEVVQRLSIFRGQYDRPAATVIANASRRAGGGGGQYEMHELTRQIAAERLAADRQLHEETEQTHALYFARYLEERADTLYGPKTVQHFIDIDLRFGDICLAWGYLVREAQFEQLYTIVDVLYGYCRIRGKFLQGIELLESALTLLTTRKKSPVEIRLLQVQLLSRQALLYCVIGKQEQAQALIDKAQKLSQSVTVQPPELVEGGTLASTGSASMGHERLPQSRLPNELQSTLCVETTVAFYLYARLYIYTFSAVEDMAEIEQLYRRGVTLYEYADVPVGVALMHNMRGVVAHNQGHLREAHRFYEMGYEIALSIEYYQLLSTTLQNLGKISQDLGKYDESMDYLKQSLHYQYALNDEEGVAYVSRNMARVEMFWGNYQTACMLAQKALEIFKTINFQRGVAFTLQLLGEASYLTGKLGDAEACLEQGMALCDRFGYAREATEIAITQGYLMLHQQRIAEAQTYGDLVLDLAKQAQSQAYEGLAHTFAGEATLAQGKGPQAQLLFEQAIAVGQACDMPLIWLQAKAGLAALAIKEGEVAQAEQLLQDVLEHRAVTHKLQQRCEALLKMATAD